MKKTVLIVLVIFISLFSISCSKEASVKRKFKKEISSSLLDPSSYQFVSIEPYDLKEENVKTCEIAIDSLISFNFRMCLKYLDMYYDYDNYDYKYKSKDFQEYNEKIFDYKIKTISFFSSAEIYNNAYYIIKFRAKSKMGLDVLGSYLVMVDDDDSISIVDYDELEEMWNYVGFNPNNVKEDTDAQFLLSKKEDKI